MASNLRAAAASTLLLLGSPSLSSASTTLEPGRNASSYLRAGVPSFASSGCSAYSGTEDGMCSLCTSQTQDLRDCFWCSEDNSCHNAWSPDFPSSCWDVGCVSHASLTSCTGACTAGKVSGFDVPFAQCMLGISNASYYTGKTLNEAMSAIGISSSQYKLMDDSNLDTQGLVIAHPSANAITIVYRGTELGLKNGALDIDATLQDYTTKINSQSKSTTAKWQVANGFASAYLSLQSQLKTNLQWAVSQVSSKPKLYITGHSLGAAMASIAASDIVLSSLVSVVGSVEVIIFAPPRAGNDAYASDLGGLVSNWWGIQNFFDQVPHLPTQAMGYKHTERIVIVGPNDGNIVEVSPDQDDEHFNVTANPIGFHYTASYMAQLNALTGASPGPTACPDSVLS